MTDSVAQKPREPGRKLRDIRESVRFVLPLAWQANRRLCILTVASCLLAAAISPLLVVLTGAAVNEIRDAVDGAEAGGGSITFWLWAAGLGTVLLAISTVFRRYTRLRLHDEIKLRIDHQVLAHAAQLDYETREDLQTQNCIRRATTNPGNIVLHTALGMINAVSAAIRSVGLLAVLLWIEPFWSGVLLLLGIPHLTAQWYLSKSRFHVLRNRTTAMRYCQYYHTRLAAPELVPAIRTLGIAPYLLDRFRTSAETIRDAGRRIYLQEAVVNFVSSVLTVLAVILVVAIVGHNALVGGVSTGEFVAFWIAAWRLVQSISRLAAGLSELFGGHFDVVNLREFMALRPRSERNLNLPSPVLGKLTCRNVSYRYPGSSRPAVLNVDLELQPGETIALVGPNGAGKSTLARLLAGLYEPKSGQVLLDDVCVSRLDPDKLHPQLTYLPQSVFRLEATAHENIAIGDAERLLEDPAAVRAIGERTGVDRFLAALPNGYETHLGRVFGESDLSGGQWQRLAVARSLSADPGIVILDEPFANLDASAEQHQLEVMRDLLAKPTAIVISHRFSMLRYVDRIVVMDDGRIVEQGTHDQLVALSGLYASLYRDSMARFQLDQQDREAA